MKYLVVLAAIVVTGCASTSHVPSSGTGFTLDGCSPFLNCVSSTSTVGLYQVAPIQLPGQLDEQAWIKVRKTAIRLPGATLNESRFGYLDITVYSDLLHFPDYFEVLVSPNRERLDVRSQSLIGFYDLGVNRRRVENFRQALIEQGVAVKGEGE